MTAFWEALGGKLADSWVAQLITAPVLYIAVGFAAWVSSNGWNTSGERLAQWFAGRSPAEQGLLAAGSLLVVATATTVINTFVPRVLRLLEGYWPGPSRSLARRIVNLRGSRLNAATSRWQTLEGLKAKQPGLTPTQEAELAQLDLSLRRVPADESQRLATKLGNVLRASESRPREKYGLDTVIVWPHLWLLLPASTREEIGDARSSLDQAVAGVIWGLLLAAWEVVTWWPILIVLPVAGFFYYRACSSAETYGDLLEAAFDLNRSDLYRRLRVDLPRNSDEERELGEKVTQFLWRGQGQFEYVAED